MAAYSTGDKNPQCKICKKGYSLDPKDKTYCLKQAVPNCKEF